MDRKIYPSPLTLSFESFSTLQHLQRKVSESFWSKAGKIEKSISKYLEYQELFPLPQDGLCVGQRSAGARDRVMCCSCAKTSKKHVMPNAFCFFVLLSYLSYLSCSCFNSVLPTGDLPRHPGLPTHRGACNVSQKFTTRVPRCQEGDVVNLDVSIFHQGVRDVAISVQKVQVS